jgi:hypothetical protein
VNIVQARREVLEALGLLASAREPLTLRMLEQLFGPEGTAQMEQLFGLAAGLFVSRPLGRAYDAPFLFFHSSFAGFILTEHGDQTTLHAHLAAACGRWPRLDGEARCYALRHLPYHLLACRDLAALRALVRTDFLDTKASNLGNHYALIDASGIAQALVDGGEECWNDLLSCASTYCKLAGDARHRFGLLDALVHAGDVAAIEAAVTLEPDPFFRGVVLLTAAVSLAELGRKIEAKQLRERGVSLVHGNRFQMEQELFWNADMFWNSNSRINTIALALELEPESVRPDSENQAQYRAVATIPTLGQASPEPRRAIPLPEVLTFYPFTSATLGLVLLCAPSVVLPPDTRLGWCFLLFYTLLLPATLLLAWAPVLLSKRQRVERLLDALLETSRQPSAATGYRVLRYYACMRHALGTSPAARSFESFAEPRVGRLAVDLFRGCATSSERARLIQQATAGGERVCDILADELRRIAPTELEAIYRDGLAHPSRVRDRYQWLRLMVATSDSWFDSEVFYESIPPDLSIRSVAVLLTRLSPSHLSLLAFVGIARRGARIGRLPKWNSLGWLIDGLTLPMNYCEPILCLVCALFGSLFLSVLAVALPGTILYGGVFLLTIFICGLVAVFAASSCTYDPFGMSECYFGDLSISAIRERLQKSDEKTAVTDITTKRLSRRVRDHLVAHLLLCGHKPSLDGIIEHNASTIRRVLQKLVSEGLLRSGDAVMAAMPHGEATVSAVSRMIVRRQLPSARQPNRKEIDQLLGSALPMPIWLNLVITAIVAAMAAWMSNTVAVLVVVSQAHESTVLWSQLGLGLWFAAGQHLRVPQNDDRRMLHGYWVYIGGILLAFVLTRLTFWQSVMVAAQTLLVTNLIVPEFIARWRGAGLFCPRNARLWGHRLASAAAMLLLSTALASITHLFLQRGTAALFPFSRR